MRALDGEPITQVTEAERLLESRRQGLLGRYSKTLSQKQQQQTLKSGRIAWAMCEYQLFHTET